jgi:hypothetical protein
MFAAAGALQAFPFQIGRSMEYSVLRRGGAESAIVTILPIDTTRDSAGTNWRIQVKDSSRASALVRVDTAVLVRDGSDGMAWVESSCLVPWDLGDPATNFVRTAAPVPGSTIPVLKWGGLSMLCAGAKGQTMGASYFAIPTIVNREHSDLGDYTTTTQMPQIQGRWTSDSGWILLQDGYAQQAWQLLRIGPGPLVAPRNGFAKSRWLQVKVGDRWNWRRTMTWKVAGVAPTRTGDTTFDLEWKALERLGDTGVAGTWRFARQIQGIPAETLSIDFDSPFAQVESRPMQDPARTAFSRGASPSWYDDTQTRRSNTWTTSFTGTPAMTNFDTTTRVYEYAEGFGVVKMEQTFHAVADNAMVIHQTTDSTLTVELVSHNGIPISGASRVSSPATSIAPITSRAGLDRFLASGGRILSIRDASGRSFRNGSADPAVALRSRRGLVFLEAAAPTGERFAVRLVLP